MNKAVNRPTADGPLGLTRDARHRYTWKTIAVWFEVPNGMQVRVAGAPVAHDLAESPSLPDEGCGATLR
jgi:hypothetical protein